MIHDACVEVTCDGKRCKENVYVMLEFVYPDLSGKNGYYNHDDKAVEKRLVRDHDWIVRDGKNFCTADCAGEDG